MHIVRLLYLYIVSFIGLWVLAAGLAGLLQLVVEGIWPADASLIAGPRNPLAEELSRSLALAGVGLPLWTLHWWLVERGTDEGPMEDERIFRALYLALVLLIATVSLVISAIDGVSRVLGAVLGADAGAPGGEGSIAWLLVALAVWGYHARVLLRTDGLWRHGPPAGAHPPAPPGAPPRSAPPPAYGDSGR